MWADAETEIDFLNYSEVAELVAELIGTPDLMPLSLGVFGPWGTGKSSTLKFVKTELLRTPDKYLIIEFDAWLCGPTCFCCSPAWPELLQPKSANSEQH